MAIRQADERLPSWQAMDSGRLLLLAAVGMTGRGRAGAHGRRRPDVDPRTAIAFGSVIAVGELLRLGAARRPGGGADRHGRRAGLRAAAAGRAAPPHPVPRIPALQVIAVTAIGMIVGALPHVAAGRPAGLTGMATRLVAVACVAFVFRPLAGTEAISGTRSLVGRVRA